MELNEGDIKRKRKNKKKRKERKKRQESGTWNNETQPSGETTM